MYETKQAANPEISPYSCSGVVHTSRQGTDTLFGYLTRIGAAGRPRRKDRWQRIMG